MNTSTSEYSSGCESGWTMYLDQNSNSTDPYSRGYAYDQYEEKGAYAYTIHEEDDEDLSMVSDASSGPPHYRHYDNSQYYGGYVSEDKTKSMTKTKTKTKSSSRKEPKQQSLCLDDTASSSIFHFSQVNSLVRERDRNMLIFFYFYYLCKIFAVATHRSACIDYFDCNHLFIIGFQDNVPHSDNHNSVGNVHSASHFEVLLHTTKLQGSWFIIFFSCKLVQLLQHIHNIMS